MKNLLLPVTAAILVLSSLAAQATPLTGPAQPPLTGHYKPKWTQGPNMIDANDTLSMHRSNGPVVADDFVSDGRIIAGFHWWGSYFQDSGQGLERDVLFEISFHEDCPANDPGCNNGGPFPYSTPSNSPSYFSDILVVEEDFYGTSDDGVDIYEYWALVDQNNGPGFLNGSWWETAGETYWLDVAWAAGQFGTNPLAGVWGWARADNGGVCILDCAVTTAAGVVGNPHIGPWAVLDREDMAFEVITVPEPGVLALFGLGLAGLGFSRRRKV